MTTSQRLTIAGAVLFVILLIPTPYLASPEWTVVVRDEAGHPLHGLLLRLSYENYSVENTGHEIDLYSDSDGRVIFPPQRGYAILLSRCYYTLHSAMALAHASFGPSAFVSVFGDGREGSVNAPDGTVYFWNGRPDHVVSTVVALPRDN